MIHLRYYYIYIYIYIYLYIYILHRGNIDVYNIVTTLSKILLLYFIIYLFHNLKLTNYYL